MIRTPRRLPGFLAGDPSLPRLANPLPSALRAAFSARLRARLRAALPAVLLTALLTTVPGCTGIPPGTQAVTGFELQRYLGKWFEIARLDHSFERGLDCVTAEYSLRDDGGVRVINRGVNLESGAQKEAEGRAYFVEDPSTARLKVSFFGPFFGGYNVLALDPDYQWALVAGPNTRYLWILARTPQLSPEIEDPLIAIAAQAGFPTEDLIRVNQGPACPN